MADLEDELAEQMEIANWAMRLNRLLEKAKHHGPKYVAGYKKGLNDGSKMAQMVIIEAILDEAGKDPQFEAKMTKILSAPRRII